MIPLIPWSSADVNEFLITCIDRVEAPPASLCPTACPNDAFKNLGASNPLC